MTLTIGTQLGSHEITALLGKGGMGEVYRARDLKLKREVAIKILPEEFSRDADRLSRFQREAGVLASLNHPNIAGIHEFAEAHGSR
jgi:serine/threonine protein kinase